jgi:hypothetical protein
MVAKLSEIKKILKVLRENGVSEYKNGDFYVKLDERAFRRSVMVENKLEPDQNQKQQQEEDLFYSGV